MQPPSNSQTPEPESRVQGADQSVDRQLARLYGEDLFGTWSDPIDHLVSRRREHKRGRRSRRIGILVLSVLLVSAGVWLTRRGLARRAGQERAHVAKDVAAFLAEGELDRLAQFLSILSPTGQALHAADPYLDLIVSAEAALYRYQDASPERLARIQPFLSPTDAPPKRLLARLTVASRAERAASYDVLQGLLPTFARDPEYRTLMATVEERRYDAKTARQSWNRSFEAGPLWLPHRYSQCIFEARQHNAEALGRLTKHLARVAPESAWTRMAWNHFASKATPPAASGAPKPASRVAKHHEQLALVLESLAAGQPRSARQALERALDAVHGQAPFVLDAFDGLVEAGARELAVELASFEAWPRSNPSAQARLEELHAKAAEPAPAPSVTPALPKAQVDAPAKAKPERSAKAKGKKAAVAKRKRAPAKKHGGRSRR